MTDRWLRFFFGSLYIELREARVAMKKLAADNSAEKSPSVDYEQLQAMWRTP